MEKFARYEDPNDLGNKEPEDLFSSVHYASVRDAGAGLRSLPLWCYTSERFQQAEKEKIFLRQWNLLERADIVPKAGDFHCTTFLGIALLVVRGRDDKVRVFANSCRHRGALVAEGSGNCKVFKCPYHFWTYNLDGSLKGAPHYDDAAGRSLIDDSNREEFGLAEIESGCWGGFVFIRLSRGGNKTGGASLVDHLGNFVETLASHRLEEMAVGRRVVYDMAANWKCFFENYIDAYHIPYVHKNSLSRWKVERYVIPDPTGNETIAFAEHDGSQLLLPFPDYRGFPPMPEIDPDKARGTIFTTLLPGMMMTLGNDGALVFQSEPITADRSKLTVTSLFPKAYCQRDDFEELAQNYYRRNDRVVVEDKDIALRQYAGLRSPYARIARLCEQERRLSGFANWIIDEVIGPVAKEAKAAE